MLRGNKVKKREGFSSNYVIYKTAEEDSELIFENPTRMRCGSTVGEMSFEGCIKTLREELNLIHPVVRKEKKQTDEERRVQLIEQIQLIVWKLMADIANDQSPSFCSSARATWESCCFDGRVNFNLSGKAKRIGFSRRRGRSEFAAIIFLLSKIHKLLMTHQTSTRREIYYQNLEIFKSQTQVDKGMREICYMLNAGAWELRVSSAPKGTVAGPVVLTLPNGESLDCGIPGGVCIPQNVIQIEKMSSSATWVLIVEKDACFQSLLAVQAANKLANCILITGKGFPDVSSRILVCKFWEHLKIPILALVDADPHGFEIMCVYRFGSLSMSPHSGHLACPAVRWLGVHPTDIRPLLLDSKILSIADRKKIECLLKRGYVEENKNLKAQLEVLLEGNVKAEIEGVASISNNYLTNVYMINKIQCKEYL